MQFAVLLLCLMPLVSRAISPDAAYDDNHLAAEVIESHECAENEVWMECSSCEVQCGTKPTICPRICQPARCQCPSHKGFRRNAQGSCVKC